MTEEKQYYPLSMVEDIQKTGEETITKVVLEDAGSKSAEILMPNFGSDDNWMREGKVDYRRFTHLDEVDPYWMAYFRLIEKERGGNFMSNFVEEVANFLYSVNGRHKMLSVDMQKAVSGREIKPKEKKKRSLTDRILGRNKDVE